MPAMLIRLLILSLGWFALSHAAEVPALRTWDIDGVTRQALVYVPPHATTQATPVIFAFHGHGGGMRGIARTWAYQTLWSDALVIYPQGLPTPGMLTDQAGARTGWQAAVGKQADRDLKFFDAMLASLRKEYRVDDHRVYATGFSNGGLFTYVLWSARGDQLAAVAPIAAIDPSPEPKLKPKPVFDVAGENDPLVKFAWQQRMLDVLRRVNACGPAQPAVTGCVTYPSKIAAPVVTYFHSGEHEVPAAVPALIVAFFQEHRSDPVK
jgi:polyhydroxybutyrate depolymerase